MWLPARSKHFASFVELLEKVTKQRKYIFHKTVQSEAGFFVGTKVSFADLMIATFLDMFDRLYPDEEDVFDGFEPLKDYRDRVGSTNYEQTWKKWNLSDPGAAGARDAHAAAARLPILRRCSPCCC